jgi:glycosyltransferase involved in cell wall biosynthesis
MIFYFSIGYRRLSVFTGSKNKEETEFSILIPFRNESEHLPELLQSLTGIIYPKKNFEIWMIDDESSDNSVEIIQAFISENPSLQIHIINNNRKTTSAKKDAIHSALELSSFDWIVTTDADCLLPENWLQLFDQAIEKNKPVLLAAPVGYSKIGQTVLDQIQFFEFLSLQIITIGAFGMEKPFMCNGANLCYNKTFFLSVNGFEGNEDFAGGDDLFLMEKMLESNSEGVYFIKNKDCLVKTKTENSWNSFFSQRIRWAAKSSGYKQIIGKLTGLIVFFGNLTLVILFITSVVYSTIWGLTLFCFIVKSFIDLTLLLNGKAIFKRQILPVYFLASSFIYPFLNVYIGLRSFFGFTWKDRSYQK